MNFTLSDKTQAFTSYHLIAAILIAWDLIASSTVLWLIMKRENLEKTKFELHVISMSIKDFGLGVLAIPRWILNVSITCQNDKSIFFKHIINH